MTKEGAPAVQELIAFLNSAPALGPLAWKADMSLACRDHCEDTGPKGMTGHDSSDGSSFSDRLKKYGLTSGMSGENISYGGTNGRAVVMQLLTDDGVPSRGHRANIFNADFKVMGCCSGEHKQYGSMTCLDYAAGWRKEGQEDPMKAAMNAIAAEKIDFDTPDGARGWSESSQMSSDGKKVSKTTTMTYNMADGSTKVLEKTIERQIAY